MVYAGGAFATWERDCVYSVLGLASDIDILNLKPVYDSHATTTIDIYEQLVRSQINASACLDLISFASNSQRDPSKKCPSWVPYWPTYSSKSYDRMAWQSFTALSHIHRGLAETPEQARALYRASGGCAYRCPSQTTQPGILCCEGYRLDRIDLDADPSIIDMTQRFEDQVAITGMDEQLQLKSFKHLPPENLWKTVVLDRDDTYLDKVCPIEHRDGFLQLYNDAIDSPKTLDAELLEWFVAHAEQLFGSLPQKSKIIEDLRATEGMSYRSLSNFENQLLHVWFNMRKSPVRLESGSWAMIPPNTKSGDQVYILAGCNFPVLLRETGQEGEFELIGECYVDGFMDGQGIPLDQGNMKWQTISLV
ncbi:hypothetical protein PFICI_13505 [Pestalotiopsis fici W106-1]|uniref:Heterokaryon incompatibility domain-containing protein n=1 Tax=Pestalotiopsis fici (strain W106-1 / CGMCC3.15140) TaxID=1229662 RepID=W3WQB4_PESFW|nr:uncharacterized protein PFICI_13505 [Pestalotiopsis fici W106-1]ETS75021.1 hypothetical protein PFICI_13505 [Pestalotiopsis fici W106-1]